MRASSEGERGAAPGTAEAGSAQPVLLVFSDDWGRHPSSCQHLVSHLLGGWRVLWVNTIGTRRPSLDWYTLRRGAGKLGEWLAGGAAARGSAQPGAGSNPRVIAPAMWPSFRSRAARALNRALLARAIAPRLAAGGPAVALTTLPIVADLVGVLPVARWVYYCVDDLAAWPGLDRASLERMERRLLERVDAVVAVSEHLRERLAGLGREATLLTHGVDLEHWGWADRPPAGGQGREVAPRTGGVDSEHQGRADRPPAGGQGREVAPRTGGVDPPEHQGRADRPPAGGQGREVVPRARRVGPEHPRPADRPLPPGLEAAPRPWVVFWGLIDARLDVAWLRALGERMEKGSIVLAGPEEDPDPALGEVPRLVRTGPLAYAALPALAAAAGVLVMPYRDLPATRAMQPLKLKEYLATGCPVVASALPAVAEWADACDVCASAGEFCARVLERLAGSGLPAVQRAARERLAAEGWAAKAALLERILRP